MRMRFLLLATCAACLSIGWKERDATKTPAPAIFAPHPAKTAGEVADRLNALLQPRFQERGEVFGMDRIYLPLNAHQYTHREPNGAILRQMLYDLVGRDADEKYLIAEANAPKKDYVIGFLHGVNTLGKPGEKKNGQDLLRSRAVASNRLELLVTHEQGVMTGYLEGHNKLSDWANQTLPTLSKALSASDGKAQKGEKTTEAVGAWVLTLRPVKAQAACLSCHGKAKTGDTLGVMAYAVRK